jgi:beta-barrel assembly-enhancing protease
LTLSTSQIKGLTWLFLTVGVGIAGAVGLPYLANLVPWSVEQRVGRYLGGFTPGACSVQDPESQALFQRLRGRLYPLYRADAEFPLIIQVIPGTTVNAFAALGGQISVYDGLLQKADSAEELAGVLAHEIEHVRQRHVLQGVLVQLLTTEALRVIFSGDTSWGPETAKLMLRLRFNRKQEAEADTGALQRLRDAHVATEGFAQFFERVSRMASMPAILSDHPAPEERARNARSIPAEAPTPLMTPDQWKRLQRICR